MHNDGAVGRRAGATAHDPARGAGGGNGGARGGNGRARPIGGMEFSQAEALECAREGRLLSFELEMTHACNLRCTYCYASAGKAMAAEMSFDEILAAAGQAMELGARKAVILGGGEPYLYGRLHDLIDSLKALGLHIEVFTNGTLVDAGRARFLYDRGVSVVVKRNAMTAGVQDALAGVPGTFERIETAVRCLSGAGYPDARHGFGIQTVICRQNAGEIEALWRWARDRNISPYFECPTAQGRAAADPSLQVPVREMGQIFLALCRIDREEYGVEWTPHPPLVGSSCSRHLYSMLIKANGDVHPCVGVEIALGNVRRDRLADMIRHHPVQRSLRRVYETIKGTCRECRLNGLCYGCRGNAYQLTGDCLASDPYCWMNGKYAPIEEAGM